MKTQILTLIGLALFPVLFSQSSKTFEPTPKDMVFVPQGSFVMNVIENEKLLKVSVSVEAFWMSNEITNAEYREYVNYVKQHPDSLMCWVDLASAAKNKSKFFTSGQMNTYVQCFKYFEMAVDIIDTTKLPYNDYFTHKKYDNYPVVGVSQKHAAYYCMWRTKLENERLEKKGMPAVHDYRLPLEQEWAYVAAQPLAGKAKKTENKGIQPSVSARPNDWGLYNLSGNVSEWTASSPEIKWSKSDTIEVQKDLKIARGGSWKTVTSSDERKVLDLDRTEDYIGFRIVRSYMGKK